MKKIIRLNESQFKTLIDKVINEDTPRAYVEHWENKFKKSIEVLINVGYCRNDLIKIIKEYMDPNNKV